MGRTVGTPNKITTEVRGKLESLIEGLVDSIYIEELTPNQHLKTLKLLINSSGVFILKHRHILLFKFRAP
jgi:hypothetical protein